MDPPADGHDGAQPSKRRRLNSSCHVWQSANDENTQVPPPPLPELAWSRHHLDQPWASYNHLPRAQSSTSITSLASSSSHRGGQISWPSQPTLFSGQFSSHHLPGVLPPPPSSEPVQSPWPFPYGVAPPSFHDQTWLGHPGAQPAHTGHDAMANILPPLSMSMQISCPVSVYDDQERDMESNQSSAVSGPERNNTGLSRVLCFGMVRMLS